jgi:hypothetical protein
MVGIIMGKWLPPRVTTANRTPTVWQDGLFFYDVDEQVWYVGDGVTAGGVTLKGATGDTGPTGGGLVALLDDTSPQLGGFLDPNFNYIGSDKGSNIASASPLVIGVDGDYFDVTGTTGFSSITVAANRSFRLKFTGSLTITVGAGITLNNGGEDFIVSPGDIIDFQSIAANTVVGTISKIVNNFVTLRTPQSTSSGSSKLFDGIPAGTKNIFIIINEVSLDSISFIKIKIGDSGGIESDDYINTGTLFTSISNIINNTTNNFHLMNENIADKVSGIAILSLIDNINNTWCFSSTSKSSSTSTSISAGVKTLSDELTQIVVSTNAGDFDNGSINISYQ